MWERQKCEFHSRGLLLFYENIWRNYTADCVLARMWCVETSWKFIQFKPPLSDDSPVCHRDTDQPTNLFRRAVASAINYDIYEICGGQVWI